MKKIKWILVIALIAFYVMKNDNGQIMPNVLSYIESVLPDTSKAELEPGTIVRVKDGDTVVVSINGSEYTVRMIGINTPESVHADESKNTAEGAAASEYTKGLLAEGTTVYLEYDKDLYDPYDRLLAYIWLSPDVDTSSYDDFCKYNVGAIIMQNTYCEAVYYEPNGKYKEWYESLENSVYHE